jgi:hypothetical protein
MVITSFNSCFPSMAVRAPNFALVYFLYDTLPCFT